MKQLIIISLLITTLFNSVQAQNGLTKVISKDRIIPSYYLEVTFDKTVHIIFPSAVKYIDLGSSSIIAGKADGAENVVRVKAAEKNFAGETNFSVITDEGSFYSFVVSYSDHPARLNIEMKDFIHDGKAVNRPDNSMEIYLTELGNESPKMVRTIMETIYKKNKSRIHNIGSKRFGIDYFLKGLYSHKGLLYMHMQLDNNSGVFYDIDYLVFKIVDKKIAKRTAIQETIIKPVRAFNYITSVPGKSTECTVFAFEKFTIPDKKQLVVELYEKNGGRHQSFVVKNSELIKAESIDKVKIN